MSILLIVTPIQYFAAGKKRGIMHQACFKNIVFRYYRITKLIIHKLKSIKEVFNYGIIWCNYFI